MTPEELEALDAILAMSPDPAPSLALQSRVLADALRPRRRAAPRRWLSGLAAGAALAGACAAGAVTGMAADTRRGVEPAPMGAASDPADDAAGFLAEPADPAAG